MGLFGEPFVRIVGDCGLLVEYGDAIAPEINRKVRSVGLALREHPPQGILEVIPTYRSLLIHYDPLATQPHRVIEALAAVEQGLDSIRIPPPKTVEIPVCYGGELGPDIEFVARTHGLSIQEVIRIHSEPAYQIYMLGFTPGFPFLGGLPDILTTPRLETPRTFVPAGSVGIGANQTGIYPIPSPGGWRLIGRTPVRLFAPHRPVPFLYAAGDFIRFRPISREQYDLLRAEQEAA
jgi:KipI family sensor histidine kinase inhibitor